MVVIGREPYVVRARIFIALMTAMVPLLTMLCTGLLTTEYLERRSQAKKELEQE
jgi:hypothetical protein